MDLFLGTTTGGEAIGRDSAERAPDWRPGGGADLFVGKGGDATLPIHEGVKAEEEFEKCGKVPDLSSTGVKTKIKFDTDVMMGGKVADVFGYGDVDKILAPAMKQAVVLVIVTAINPIFARQAHMQVRQVLTLEDALAQGDFVVTTTGNKDIMVDHIGHFDNEIGMPGLETYPSVKRITINPKWAFPDAKSGIIVLAEGQIMNLGCATGHPSFVMSYPFINEVIAQLEPWKENTGEYEKEVYILPKHLDEKVAALHLGKLGAKLTILTKDQADYISILVEGP